MFGFKRKTGEIDAQLTIVANSLANNYKDAARDGLKEAKRLFEALEGELPERERKRISQQIDRADERLFPLQPYRVVRGGEDKRMRLIIVRHGDPDYERDSLTEKGWREAAFLADRISRLDVKDFYVSPLGRARDTAGICPSDYEAGCSGSYNDRLGLAAPGLDRGGGILPT